MYVVFEGIDGAGKTTQISLVKKALEKKANDCYMDKLKIIDIAETEIKTTKTKMPNTELTLKYALKRIEIQPLLDENISNIVISDRSYISSIAYQGLSNRTFVEDVNRFARKPDLIFTFITNPATPVLEQVQQNYVAIVENMKNNTFIDTTTQSIEESTSDIWRKIWNHWEGHFKSIYRSRSYYDNIE